MTEEKIILVNQYIENTLHPNETSQQYTPQLLTYKLVLNNSTALVKFDSKIITEKSINELTVFLNNLNLKHKLDQSVDKTLSITH